MSRTAVNGGFRRRAVLPSTPDTRGTAGVSISKISFLKRIYRQYRPVGAAYRLPENTSHCISSFSFCFYAMPIDTHE